jgi:hypothetical protein
MEILDKLQLIPIKGQRALPSEVGCTDPMDDCYDWQYRIPWYLKGGDKCPEQSDGNVSAHQLIQPYLLQLLNDIKLTLFRHQCD